MSNTVYSLVQEYAKTTPHFKFHPAGINLIGQFVAREWRKQGGTMDQLDIVDSMEPDGLFKVYEYPKSFVPVIHEVIGRYVKMCISPKRIKNTNEKPLIKSKSEPTSMSYSSTTPKKRTRKPIKVTTPQPAFSGKKLIIKK